MAKKDIVARLLEAKHINFDEALELMQADKEYVYYPNYLGSVNVPYVSWDVSTGVANANTYNNVPFTYTGTPLNQ